MQQDDTSLAPLITSLLCSYWSIDHDLQMTKISQAFRGESRIENQLKRLTKKILPQSHIKRNFDVLKFPKIIETLCLSGIFGKYLVLN